MIVFDFIYTLYTYLGNVAVTIVFFYMMGGLFEKRKGINSFWYYLIPGLAIFLSYNWPKALFGLEFKIPFYYNFICLMGISLLFSIAFLKGLLRDKLPYLFYYYAIYKCIVFILSALYNEKSTINWKLYWVLDLLTHFILLAVMILFSNFCIHHPFKNRFQTSLTQTFMRLFAPASFFIILQMADPSIDFPYQPFISTAALILCINLPIFYLLYFNTGKAYEDRYVLVKALSETQNQLTRYRYTVLAEEEAAKVRHELKNQYFYIQTLLKEEQYDKIDQFLKDHIGELSQNANGIKTNNVLIDHILNAKLSLAHHLKIKTYTEILIPENLNIDENYFCTILLNLLDNAIEASLKEEHPDIQIQMAVRNQYLVCAVKNQVSKNVLDSNPDFKTTKENKKEHGLGMKIIKDTVRKANGIFNTSMEGNYFVASLMMPIK